MPRPAVVRHVVSHQAKAFHILLSLLQQKGIRCDIPDLLITDGAGSSIWQASPGLELTSGDWDPEPSSPNLTLAQRASRNRLSRVAHSILELLLLEENMVDHVPLDHQFTMQVKDSIEFRNICTHMALQTDDRRFDQDLSLAQECLAQIITNMTWDVSAKTCDFCQTVQQQLKLILQKLHEN
ncbi:leukemia-associated protein 7 [Gastrophryne carolinensis]